MADNLNTIRSFSGKRQILVVDDEMINREILGEYLKDDYDVLFAEDGVQAMEMVRSHKDTLSLILLDLLMPVMPGKEVLKHVKEDPELYHIPVIVMTADQESEVECLSLGAIDFIPKPYPQVSVVLARILRTIELFEDRNIIMSTERDELTGLYNKAYFYRYAELFDMYHKDTATDALYLDVIHFRMINERYGKNFGDIVLKSIAETLRRIVHDSGGIVCRREADVFLIYCPHREDYHSILEQTAEAIPAAENSAVRIWLRMGVYASVDKTIDIESRFDRAKIASDTVHDSFTKTIGIYDDELRQKEIFNEHLIDDFQTALDEKQFFVCFQPKFDVRADTPVLTSAEALVRWNHPKLGLISPGLFIPLFESNGLIQKLDSYVWQESARQIREWKNQLGFSVPVSVNVSRIDLYDPNLLKVLDRVLSENGLTGEDLFLEITESAYTQDSHQIIETVKELRRREFRIEMDDFGTGYSSLNMISNLPIDALKLDIQFIRNAFREGGNTRMLEVILEIADSLSVPVIAEGVETEEQMLALKTMGCDIIQGYYFSKPVPADEFEPFLMRAKEYRTAEEAARQADLAAMNRRKLAEVVSSDVPLNPDASAAKLPAQPVIRVDRRAADEKGIHMRTLNILFAVIAFIAGATLFLLVSVVNRGYREMKNANDNYITAMQAASDMESGSDYLTDRVRAFVVTGDEAYLRDFVEEVEVTQRREKALARLGDLLDGSDNGAYESLAAALELSNELIQRENLAMRLTVEAGEYPAEVIPDSVSSLELSAEDAALSSQELRTKATGLVFDEVYQDYKEKIRANVLQCSDFLLTSASGSLDAAEARLVRILRIQTVLTVVILAAALTFALFIRYQIRKPLEKMVSQMRTQEPVSPAGAEELRFVTRTYNEILLENKKAYAQLAHDASHDPLTGLFNRGAYEMLLKSVDLNNIALLMIDVDGFKTINDTYGHDMGDRVLVRIADVIRRSFRSSDVVCRIGGDEFIVIMTRANSSMRQLLQNKIAQVNNQLQNPRDDLPPVSLSVGVAFSDRKNPKGDIFKDADTAVYEAKNAGTGRCVIY